MSKKLTKGDPFESQLSGVCSGISEYLDIDVTIIRLIWIFCTLVYGIGIPLYIILAIIMPDKE